MTMRAKFAGKCSKCGQFMPVGTEIDWQPGQKAFHHGACPVPVQPVVVVPMTANLKALVDFVSEAKKDKILPSGKVLKGLKFPRLRVLDVDGAGELTLGVTVTGNAPGSLSVKVNGEYVGTVRPDGQVTGRLATDAVRVEHLRKLAQNPVDAFKAYAALKTVCSACGKNLTDEGSKAAGYGEACAVRYNVEWKRGGVKPALQVDAAPRSLASMVAKYGHVEKGALDTPLD